MNFSKLMGVPDNQEFEIIYMGLNDYEIKHR